jgi:membrane associated rhomboid family serine protease
MFYHSSLFSNYDKVPKSLKILICMTAIVTVCSAALEPLFIAIFKIYGPQEILGLSPWGIANSYYWQLITSLFIQKHANGINLFLLINLTFNMYMLWLFGSQLAESYGDKSFLVLYFMSGMLANLAALATVSLLSPYKIFIIAGLTPSLLAIFVAWAMLHRETTLLLFFLIPIQAKSLLAVVIAFSLLIPLSALDFVSLFYHMVGIASGYLYSAVVWQQPTPYLYMQNIDKIFMGWGHQLHTKIRRYFFSTPQKSKIVDIKTGKATLGDDAFIDEMLAKISRYGEQSLTRQEKNRMRKISEEKMRGN